MHEVGRVVSLIEFALNEFLSSSSSVNMNHSFFTRRWSDAIRNPSNSILFFVAHT